MAIPKQTLHPIFSKMGWEKSKIPTNLIFSHLCGVTEDLSSLAGCLGRNSQLAPDGSVVADCCKPFAATHLPDQVTKAMSEICLRFFG